MSISIEGLYQVVFTFLINLVIAALVGFTIYSTHEVWSLLCLLLTKTESFLIFLGELIGATLLDDSEEEEERDGSYHDTNAGFVKEVK